MIEGHSFRYYWGPPEASLHARGTLRRHEHRHGNWRGSSSRGAFEIPYRQVDKARILTATTATRPGPLDARCRMRWSSRSWRSWRWRDRKSTRLNSSHVERSYAVFCLKKKKKKRDSPAKRQTNHHNTPQT